MRKKIFFMIALGTAVAVSVFYAHADKQVASDLLLENVEALAAGEMTPAHCLGIGCVDCPVNNTKVKYVFSGYSLE